MRTGGFCRTVGRETSRFPPQERLHIPGSLTSPGRPSACCGAPVRIAFHESHRVSTRDTLFAAQWLAYALPCRRFADALASACARLGGDVDRLSFLVGGLS